MARSSNPGASWEPRNRQQAKAKAMPRAISRRAEWRYSNAATKRREENILNAARQWISLGRIMARLAAWFSPKFKQPSVSDQYLVEVE